MCCGNKTRRTIAPPPLGMLGAKGLSKLVYQGDDRFVWYGNCTGARYVFYSGNARYIDQCDVERMLALTVDSGMAFVEAE